MKDNTFAKEVMAGLSAQGKFLSSKYFYDAKGDELFIKIMQSPEYYLTNCELEIFKGQSVAIYEQIEWANRPKRIIELGAGDGSKTVHLLRAFMGKALAFTYTPIDISKNAISLIEQRLKDKLPSLEVEGRVGDYFKMLQHDKITKGEQKIVLFLGSNMGNMPHQKAADFLKNLSGQLNTGDYVLLGLDKRKASSIVLPAYNDKAGHTSAFNLNILERINRELGADFIVSQFTHTPEYNEQTGTAYSYLTSVLNQQVYIDALKTRFSFEKGERIHTEISQKYDEKIVEEVLAGSGLTVSHYFYDRQAYFMNVLLKKH